MMNFAGHGRRKCVRDHQIKFEDSLKLRAAPNATSRAEIYLAKYNYIPLDEKTRFKLRKNIGIAIGINIWKLKIKLNSKNTPKQETRSKN